jgi:hypothetical protein
VLRLLADAVGAVVTKATLQKALSDAGDDHAVEIAVRRLQQALDHRDMVATVIAGTLIMVRPGGVALPMALIRNSVRSWANGKRCRAVPVCGAGTRAPVDFRIALEPPGGFAVAETTW